MGFINWSFCGEDRLKRACVCATYPVRLVMVPRVMGCLIWARGSTTVRLGSGDSRGFPMLLLVKLLYESWLLSLPGNTKKYRIKSVLDVPWTARSEKSPFHRFGVDHYRQICQSRAFLGNGRRTLRFTLWMLVQPTTIFSGLSGSVISSVVFTDEKQCSLWIKIYHSVAD